MAHFAGHMEGEAALSRDFSGVTCPGAECGW